MRKYWVVLVALWMVNLVAADSWAVMNSHSYYSFKQALSTRHASFYDRFRNNYVLPLVYSGELVAWVKEWASMSGGSGPEMDMHLSDRQFVEALQRMASEYASKEYRFRKSKSEKLASGLRSGTDRREQVPFGDTDVYHAQKFSVTWPEARAEGGYGGTSLYRVSMPAGNAYPVEDPRYPVHQAGSGAFGITPKSLVLTVVVECYSIHEGLVQQSHAAKGSKVFWLVLPPWDKLANQGSEERAAAFAAGNTGVWLPR